VLAVAISAGLVLVVEKVEHWSLVVDPAVVALLLVLAGGIFAPSADGNPVRSVIVQGGSPCPMTHCEDENRLIYESHLALTQSIPEGSVDLVVWPENSMGTPFEPEENLEVRAALETEARRLGAYLLVSATRVVDDEEFLNTNTLFAPNGSRTGVYTKRHPVPFGEFVPLRSLFEFVPQLDRVGRDMVRGEEAVEFPTDLGVIGSVISFEGAVSRYLRDTAQAGAQLMVVATNESSFDVGPASDQLIEMVRVNTASVGQDLLHSAITGKSAIIEADGSVVATTELLEEGKLTGVVHMRAAAPTPYTRFGDWVLLVALAGAGLALVLPGEGRPDALTNGLR
jgi:apolipoprotein N-acyltransferase